MTALVMAAFLALVIMPYQTASLIRPLAPALADTLYPAHVLHEDKNLTAVAARDVALSTDAASSSKAGALPAKADSVSGDLSADVSREHLRDATPLIAQCNGIEIRSPLRPQDLSGVLFHQASYAYALVMTTELPEADSGTISPENPVRVNKSQQEGAWLDADALHLWRNTDSTEMDTSIDVGATAGTQVVSPVTGTVVLLKDYMLYDEVPDIEIHIQPEGRPDLDAVILHTQDPLVKPGDHVDAGITPLSHIRDIAAQLYDVHLAPYTAEDDPGNHVHIQINDANYEAYREEKLRDAFNPSAA